MEARRGGPVPPAAQHVRAVPAGLRRRATGADRPAAGGGLQVGRLPRPLPPTLTDRRPRPGDEALRLVTGRRPVLEAATAAAAQDQPGVTVRRGVRVAGLLSGPSAVPGVPHVTGVRTDAGEELRADLVIDAMGRRTRAADWIAALGGRPPQVEAEDKGFVYYTRYFTGPRAAPAEGPAAHAARQHLRADPVRRQRHLVGHRLHGHRRRPAQGAAPRRLLRPGRARLPAAGALARRRADHGRAADGRGARPHPRLRRRRPAGGHRPRRRRRRVGLHEPVGRPRPERRHAARAGAAAGRRRAPRRSRDVRAGVARAHRPRGRAVLLEPGAGGPAAGRGDGRAAARGASHPPRTRRRPGSSPPPARIPMCSAG